MSLFFLLIYKEDIWWKNYKRKT